MSNPKTTIAGYLLIAISLASTVQHWLAGGGIAAGDVQTIVNAVSTVMGAGLVAAKDGGH